MKVKQVKMWECPECGGVCPQAEAVTVTAYECGECEEVYEDRDEAKECCKE